VKKRVLRLTGLYMRTAEAVRAPKKHRKQPERYATLYFAEIDKKIYKKLKQL
jgi:hypothetical protein